MNAQIQEKIQNVMLFSEHLYVFSYNYMQIQSYNDIILMFQVCKLIVDIICYKCVNFGPISCVTECTNSRKNSKFSAVFRAAIRLLVHLYANAKL